MFAHHIRIAALALAGGALIVTTSLMTTMAAAAPADSQPSAADAETVAVQPVVNLPRADGEIAYVNNYPNGGGSNFAYLVMNHGPERAAIKYKMYVLGKSCADCNSLMWDKSGTVALDPGATITIEVYAFCRPLSPTIPCFATGGEVTTLGLDPNPSNNTDSANLSGS
jgi:hypothetical protein